MIRPWQFSGTRVCKEYENFYSTLLLITNIFKITISTIFYKSSHYYLHIEIRSTSFPKQTHLKFSSSLFSSRSASIGNHRPLQSSRSRAEAARDTANIFSIITLNNIDDVDPRGRGLGVTGPARSRVVGR